MVHVRPDTPVLIDHLDGPHMGNAVEYANVLALAQFDNVFMKLSGLNHFSKDAPLYLEAKPFTQLVIDAVARSTWCGAAARPPSSTRICIASWRRRGPWSRVGTWQGCWRADPAGRRGAQWAGSLCFSIKPTDVCLSA